MANEYDRLDAVERLNLFRNKYYTDGNSTENGAVANAINDVVPRYLYLANMMDCLYAQVEAKYKNASGGERIAYRAVLDMIADVTPTN